MNTLTAQGLLNPTDILLLGGIVLLLLNIVYGLTRASRGDTIAGLVTVIPVLLACSLAIVGSVQVASANSATASAFRAQRAGAQGTPAASVATTAVPIDASAAPTVDPAGSADPSVTAAATIAATPTRGGGQGARNGTPGARSGTPGANRSARTPGATTGTASPDAASTASGTGNGAAGGNGSAGGGNAAGGGGAPTITTSGNTATSTDTANAQIILILGGVALVMAAVLYLIERRAPTFNLSSSRGLLNLFGAAFVMIAFLIIPMIPAQFNSVNQASAASASSGRAAGFPTRAVITATPTATEMPTETPTPLPSFTPTATDAPNILPTQIVYVNAQPMATAASAQSAALNPATSCTVTATNNLNLRGDPSTTHPLLLTIPAGTTLTVSGKSADKTWWKISYNSGSSTIVGWVSAQYTTNNGKCGTVPTFQQ